MSFKVSNRSEGGFTLLEVMMALAILASMMTLVWGAYSQINVIKNRMEDVAERYHQIRLASNRMAREISMAYLSKNDLFYMGGGVSNAPQVPRTLFVSERSSQVDVLTFSALAHTRMKENAKESDQTVIRYYAAEDRINKDITNLMRRESRRLGSNRPGEEGPAYVMLEDIEELHYEFFDEQANEWKERWNTRSIDGQPDRLPTKVRIAITVKNEHDREVTFYSATRVFLRDPLWFSPQ
jgi:general secretion pathway protein J